MTNSTKLRGRIVEKGYTLGKFAEVIHLSRVSLRKKMNGESEFKASELENICAILDIPSSQIDSYFFTNNVPKMGR
ncbi:MAG: DUF739 family protein [Ruminococcus sp.]|nr:DUF739 family protein [Ruminiclostridium sp.]MBP1537398.1 DUF739 family protein [Ruminococcus sp.]